MLDHPDRYAVPFDVSRQPVDRRRRSGRGTDGGRDTPPVNADATRAGHGVLVDELEQVAAELPLDPAEPAEVDAMLLLRRPLARSTAAALLPGADSGDRDLVADRVLGWVDALGPVISADRPPGRFSTSGRDERRARAALVRELVRVGTDDPPALAATLAAGVQVPIAAAAWALTQLAGRPALHARLRGGEELALPIAWEVLRVYPPTWIIPRITTSEVELGGVRVPPYRPVLVSPFALGQLPDLVPGPAEGCAELAEFDPDRWAGGDRRPGGWLPFGSGPHACPGRNLGLAQLVEVIGWAGRLDLTADGLPDVDTNRGLSPRTAAVRVRRSSEKP